MIQRQAQVTDENGIPVQGASVYVYNQNGTDATLTSDGSASLAQPVITDQFGAYSYYAAPGLYREDTWYGGKLRFREIYALGAIIAHQANSVAADVPTLVSDFNSLLAKLIASGLMAAS